MVRALTSEAGGKLDANTLRERGRAMSDNVRPAGNAVSGDQRIAPQDLKQRLLAADVVAVAAGLLLAFGWRALVKSETDLRGMREHMMLAIVTFPVWPLALYLNKLYLARAVERQPEEMRRIVLSSLMSVGCIVALAFAARYQTLSRLWVLSVLTFVPLCLVAERAAARRIFARLRREGRIVRRVLVVGTDSEAIGLVHATQRRPELGYHAVGFVGPDNIGTRGGCEVLGGFADTEAVLEATGSTGVLISLASVEPELVNRLTRQLTDDGYHVALSSGLRDIDIVRFRAQDIAGHTLIYVEPTLRDGWRAIAKRAFDIAFSLMALIVASPILLAVAIAIRLETKGPVFFTQARVGRHGKVFRIIKLRTMVADADTRKAELAGRNEADGPMFKIADDPRITRVGKVLRKLSLDEIPQFVNVLRGEMSIVGPRPALPTEVEEWTDDVHERLRVLPGITGMWQVSGRSDTTFAEYKRLDLYYVDNWSLAHDVRIVAKTFGVVLARRGAR
jgi:exopolysaccharide biosynthesis polyprenyl glycosylphosphotransferase